MKRLTIAATLLLCACSSPEGKLNSDPNSNPNGNPNNVNVNPNNLNSVNGTPNSTSGTFVDPNDFDQTCEWDSECAMVWGGDVCGCGSICGDAIASSAVQDFQDAVMAVDCTNVEPQPCPGGACQEQMAVCSSGTCQATPVVEVWAENFDQSCNESSDCIQVQQGRACSDCNCDFGTINIEASDEYAASWGDVECTPGPEVCDCARPPDPLCIEGTCGFEF